MSLPPRPRPLRRDALPPLRAQRPAAARRSRSGCGTTSATTGRSRPARDPAPRVRPRHHPLRPRQQLRAALRLGRGELRPDPAPGPRALPRRAGHLDQGRLRHVARAVRRVGLAQVPARQPRPEPAAHGPRLRRHLLLAPLRPRHAAGGDDRRARHRRAPGQGALRRHLLLLGAAHRGGGRDPARRSARRCSSTSRPTRCSTAGSRTACSTSSGARASAASSFSPLAQGMLTDRYLDGVPEDSRAARDELASRATCSATRTSRTCARSTRSPAARGQTLAQMALAWTLRDPRVTSALIGASSVEQLEQNLGGARAPGLRRRRAGRDRPPRGRRRDQPLGGLERGVNMRRAARPGFALAWPGLSVGPDGYRRGDSTLHPEGLLHGFSPSRAPAHRMRGARDPRPRRRAGRRGRRGRPRLRPEREGLRPEHADERRSRRPSTRSPRSRSPTSSARDRYALLFKPGTYGIGRRAAQLPGRLLHRGRRPRRVAATTSRSTARSTSTTSA